MSNDLLLEDADRLAGSLMQLGYFPPYMTAEETASMLRALVRRCKAQSLSPEVERVVLATEKGLTPFGECIAALEDFVRAEDDWLREKGGIGEDKFDDPLSDAYKRAKRALSAFGPQKQEPK